MKIDIPDKLLEVLNERTALTQIKDEQFLAKVEGGG